MLTGDKENEVTRLEKNSPRLFVRFMLETEKAKEEGLKILRRHPVQCIIINEMAREENEGEWIQKSPLITPLMRFNNQLNKTVPTYERSSL